MEGLFTRKQSTGLGAPSPSRRDDCCLPEGALRFWRTSWDGPTVHYPQAVAKDLPIAHPQSGVADVNALSFEMDTAPRVIGTWTRSRRVDPRLRGRECGEWGRRESFGVARDSAGAGETKNVHPRSAIFLSAGSVSPQKAGRPSSRMAPGP